MFLGAIPPIFVFVGLLLLTIYLWHKYHYSYWQRRGIPHISPLPLLGNLRNLLALRISFGELFRQLHSNAETNDAPLVGIYILHTPALLVKDPELINLVLVKNFNMFLNRYEAADPYHDDMGSLCLPLAKYSIWRESRKRMATFFTSGQMKYNMYPQMLVIAKELEQHIEREFSKTTESAVTLEVKELCALFTTDLTALLSYGIRANCLRNVDAPFRKQTQELLKPSWMKALHFFIIFFLPHLTDLFRAKVFTKPYADFMRKTVRDIEQKIHQETTTNLMELLIKFREEFTNSAHFSNKSDFVASQAAIFMLAGFETSSSLIAFTLYELAKQPTVQHRLHLEIRRALKEEHNNSSVSYKRLTKMSYLHMVVAEALRLYPAASFINRECTPPAGANGCTFRPFLDYDVPAGMPAYISILGLHRDPKYWPNPEHFDPERFSMKNIQLHHPMTYIPFGSGPHSCIGSRLGILQVKLGLVHILKNYTVIFCSRTVPEIIFDPKSFMLQSKGGIYLKFIESKEPMY